MEQLHEGPAGASRLSDQQLLRRMDEFLHPHRYHPKAEERGRRARVLWNIIVARCAGEAK